MSHPPHALSPPRRCLVVGGLGYAGAWISNNLAACGHEVFALSRRPEKIDLGAPYSLIQADIEALDPEDLARLLPDRPDCVIHAASYTDFRNPDYIRKALSVDCLGTRNLLEALRLRQGDGNASPPLVIYLSTFHVYGRSSGEISESDPPRPGNDYALTHFFAEEYCRLYTRTAGLPHIIVRLTNGYGRPKTPGGPAWRLLLNDLCRMAANNGLVRLNSSPSIRRDFVWLGDLAAVMEKLLGRRDLAGSVFNVATGRSVSIGEVASLVAGIASEQQDKEVPLIMPELESPDPPPLVVSNRAVCEATGIRFQDRMREEIAALLQMATAQRA